MMHSEDSRYNIKVEIELNIDRQEILRYLGYRNNILADDTTNNTIDECVEEIQKIARKNYSYSFYDIDTSDNVILEETGIVLGGKDIKKHLDGCSKCSILVVTLGSDIDKRIRYYNSTDLSKSVIFNACATAGVEALCDTVNSMIMKIASNNGYSVTSRYSPGYGDLSLEHQRDILNVVDSSSIGLTINEDNILIPRKSITAIIGLGRDIQTNVKSCNECGFKDNCLFTKDGDVCGLSR